MSGAFVGHLVGWWPEMSVGQPRPTWRTSVVRHVRHRRSGLRKGGRDHLDVGPGEKFCRRIAAAAFVEVGSACGSSARAGAQRAAWAIVWRLCKGMAQRWCIWWHGSEHGPEGFVVPAGGQAQKKGPTSCPAGPITPPLHGRIDQTGGRRERGGARLESARSGVAG